MIYSSGLTKKYGVAKDLEKPKNNLNFFDNFCLFFILNI